MADSRTFRFYDYYEAQRFARHLEDEGHRAEVHEFVFGLAPWASPEVRVVTFEGGLAGDPDGEGGDPRPFGELEPGTTGRGIDEALRLLTASAIGLTIPLGIYVAVKGKLRLPPPTPEMFLTACFSVVLLVLGMAASIAAYRGYRADGPVAVAVMRLTAGLVFLALFDLYTGFSALLFFILVGGRIAY